MKRRRGGRDGYDAAQTVGAGELPVWTLMCLLALDRGDGVDNEMPHSSRDKLIHMTTYKIHTQYS